MIYDKEKAEKEFVEKLANNLRERWRKEEQKFEDVRIENLQYRNRIVKTKRK